MCDCSSESTEEAEKVVKQVYLTCDVDGTNNVPVSVLLDFINKPDSAFNFAVLKDKLDPEGNDPSVTCETFLRVVKEWSHCDHFLNLNFDNNSYCDHEQESIFAKISYFEQHIKQLKHKNKLLNQELVHIKNHAMDVEEHCETLQNEKDKYLQKLVETEKNVEGRLTKENDVEYTVAGDHHESDDSDLKKLLNNALKDIEEFKRKIEKTEEEKKELQNQVNLFRQREKIEIEIIKGLEQEIEVKKQELLQHRDDNTKLLTEFNDQQEHIANYVESNKILKGNISELQSIALDYELRFFYLKNILNPVTCASTLETPIHKLLKKIINLNPPKPLSSLAHLVSGNLDSPLISEDLSFENIDEDDRFSVLNDLDNNQSLVQVKLLCETSLCDEMLLADQEFHKNECRQIINKQKSQIEELELAIERIGELAQKLQNEVEHTGAKLSEKETDNNRLKAENLRLLRKVKIKNEFQEEPAEQKNRKICNFSRMELKLERCEASNEMLSELLNVERSISQTLKEEKQALADEKLIVEKRLQKALAFRKERDFACELVECGPMALEVSACTIEDRCERQHASYKACLERLSEEFTKLELKLSFDNSIDCVNHLRNLKDICMETHTVTLNYGAINRERLLSKYINLVSQKERRICSCSCVFLVLVVFVVVLVFGVRIFNSFTNVPFYIEKSYLGVPPPT